VSREQKRREPRPCYRSCLGTPCINRHLPFNINRSSFSYMYFYVMWMSVSILVYVVDVCCRFAFVGVCLISGLRGL
jgi:hypothetical protein